MGLRKKCPVGLNHEAATDGTAFIISLVRQLKGSSERKGANGFC